MNNELNQMNKTVAILKTLNQNNDKELNNLIVKYTNLISLIEDKAEMDIETFEALLKTANEQADKIIAK